MEDICIVCAEPLLYAAYGSCGHKDTCSKCVTRLRSVLKDQRCVYCQQTLPAVYVTRFAGDYTETIGPDEFERLPARAKQGELRYLDSAQAYFDDMQHFKTMKALSSYTHPVVWREAQQGGGDGDDDATDGEHHRTFATLKALKAHLQSLHKLQFCEVCLEGRKVFIAEQQLYSRAQLDRHMKTGDTEGPMAESGFKGHPECRFCRKRFYGENELYQHMHSAHEQCFLCKRAHPNRFVYYRDYPDLENHFRQEHQLCPHPDCLEKKFVVFATETELRTHTAREHGETLSKAEKRQALTIPVSFSYRRGPDADGASTSTSAAHPLAAAAATGRGAVVIGGAASVPGRFGARGRAGSRGNLVEQSATAQAVVASLDSAAVEQAVRESSAAAGSQQQPLGARGRGRTPARLPAAMQQAQQAEEPATAAPVLREADFPEMAASSSSLAPGAAASGRWAGAAGGGAGGARRAQHFPALPGSSKSAKRRAAAKKKSMAQALGVSGGSVRVVHHAAGAAAPPTEEHFPALAPSSSAGNLAAAAGASGSRPSSAGTGGGSLPSSAGVEQEGGPGGLVQLQRDNWESVLPRGKRPGSRGSTGTAEAEDEGAGPSLGRLPRPPSAQEIRGPQPEVLSPRAADAAGRGFTTQLAPGARAARRGGAKPPLPTPAPAADAPADAPAAPAPAAVSAGGISEALREANRLLVARIKAQLSAHEFGQFRHQSAAWVRGEASSEQYHAGITALGLVSLVPDLAATCPDAAKRVELLEVHRRAFDAEGRGKGKGQWVPPEAAAVAASQAEQFSSWQCGQCTLINAPGAAVCEACSAPKLRPGDAANQWREQRLAAAVAAPPAVAAAAVTPVPRKQPAAAAAAAPPVVSLDEMPPLPGAPAAAAPKRPVVKQKLDGGWRVPPAAVTTPAPAASVAAGAGAGPSSSSTSAATSAPVVSASAFPALPVAAPRSSAGAGSSSSASQPAGGAGGGSKGSKGGKGKKKQSLQDFYGSTTVKTGNAWKKAPGALAQEERALLDAYGK